MCWSSAAPSRRSGRTSPQTWRSTSWLCLHLWLQRKKGREENERLAINIYGKQVANQASIAQQKYTLFVHDNFASWSFNSRHTHMQTFKSNKRKMFSHLLTEPWPQSNPYSNQPQPAGLILFFLIHGSPHALPPLGTLCFRRSYVQRFPFRFIIRSHASVPHPPPLA